MAEENLILVKDTADELLADFQYARRKRYRIILRRRILFTQPGMEYWDLVIPEHPISGHVKYLLRLDGNEWVKLIGLNSLSPSEENELIARLQPLLKRWA